MAGKPTGKTRADRPVPDGLPSLSLFLRALTGRLIPIIWAMLAVHQADAATLVSLTTCEQVTQPGTQPVGVTSKFRPDVPEIHVVAVVKDVNAPMVFKGTWVAVDAIQTPNYEIDSSEVRVDKEGEATLHFSISKPTQDWPVGNYRLDLSLSGRPFGKVPFAVVAAAKPGGTAEFKLGPVRKDPERAWTVVVYIDGDNDLEPFALKDLDEMERAMPGKGVEVIALLDRAEGHSTEEGDWTDARVFRVRPDAHKGIRSEVLGSPGELNMGDPNVLQAFLSAAIKTFPARQYALILWNHGGGWSGLATDENAPGAPNNFDKLTLPKLRGAISGALREAGLNKLDLIGFDMCLMAQLEVAYEIEGLADVMVGSEASEPGDGWPYEAVLPLFANPNLSAHDIARGIVKAYDDFYQLRQEQLATQSAFDLAHVGGVVRALDAFLTKLGGTLPQVWPSLTRTMFYSESYGDLKDLRRGPRALLSVDVGDAFQNLAGVQPALPSSPEYRALQDAMGKFVLDRKNSHRYRRSQGVSMYAPFRSDLFNKEYLETRFAQASQWPQVLRQLYAIQAGIPTKPRVMGIETVSLLRQQRVNEVIQFGQDGFAFRFDGNNLLWAFASIGIRDESKRQTLVFQKSILRKEQQDEGITVQKKERRELLETYGYSDGEHLVGFRYDATRRLVANGEAAFFATMDESSIGNLDAHMISVPAIYEHPRVGKCFATLYFNWLWQAVAVLLEIPQRDGSFVNTRIEPEPDADIHLLVESVPDQGERSYVVTGTLKWKDGLFLTVDLAPPGEYEVLLTLESLSGLSNTAQHRFRVAARDDDLFKGVQTAHQEFIPENFIGEWELIDAREWFRSGRMVSIQGFVKYEPHPRYPGLLKYSLSRPRGKDLFPGLDVVDIIQRAGLPHLRQYVLDERGRPRPDFGYRMSFPVFDYKDGDYLMLDLDLATGELGVKVKRSGPTPKLATATPPAAPGGLGSGPGTAPPAGIAPREGMAASLMGAWMAFDGSRIVFQGNQWAYSEGNRVVDGGVFSVQGDQLIADSATTRQRYLYLFAVSGNHLQLRDASGQVYRYFRGR